MEVCTPPPLGKSHQLISLGHKVQRPLNALAAQMSTQYTVAAQLLDGSVLMDQFKSAKIDRDELWQLVGKVDCVWNRAFDKLSTWHTRVTVDFGKGYTVCHEVSGPTTFDDALSNEGIRSKWSMLADRFVLLQPVIPLFKPN